MTGATAAAAAHHAAVLKAYRSMGIFVKIDSRDFLQLLERAEAPVVVHSRFGFFTKKDRYIQSYKGFAFYTDVDQTLDLPKSCELVESQGSMLPT
ncbi:MAG: hypothetical protein HY286_17995 [Planctomycetes bacterium]|nr:hypothetical protein [Planctomycetota bacterium]